MKRKQEVKSVYATCLITGKKHYIYGPSLQKKIETFGSLEDFVSNFICSQAKKHLKDGFTQDETRKRLNIKLVLPQVKDDVLIRNKIKKTNKREKKAKTTDYINSEEYAVKKKLESQTINNWSSWQAYVENATGGPNGCQIKHGGTCQQPHIWFRNGEYCDGCTYYQYCLVSNKRVTKKK